MSGPPVLSRHPTFLKTDDVPTVLIIGLGSVGTIVAYTLEHLNRAKVTTVARPETIDRIKAGIRIESCSYGTIEKYIPSRVVLTSAEGLEQNGKPFDYIVITTKNIPDIAPVVDMLEDCFDEEKTTVVLIQNGIGIEIPIFRKYPKACVISGVTLINTTLYDDIVKHVAKDIIRFGPFMNYNIDQELQVRRCKKFIDLYSNENNDAQYENDVKTARWRKLVYNTCVNTTCAITNLDSGRVDVFGGMETIVRPAMEEVVAIAKSENVTLPKDIIDKMIRYEDGVWYPPSMLMDIRNNLYIEYIIIIQNVVKIANKNKVPIPTLTVLCNLLKLIQYRTMESHGKFVLPEKRPVPEDNFKIKFLY